jgi:hypothetical protein
MGLPVGASRGLERRIRASPLKTLLARRSRDGTRGIYTSGTRVILWVSLCCTNLTTGREALDEREELDQEEAHILDLLARGLSRDFPNPERVGCPGSAVLRSIAFRKLRLAEVQQWLDHLSSCSPCYREFTALRQQAVQAARS